MSRPRTTAAPYHKICSHPGCCTRMNRGSHTYDVGLCKHHGGQIKGRAVDLPREPEAPPERPGIRVVEVATMPAGGSGSAGGRARVSVAREPWE